MNYFILIICSIILPIISLKQTKPKLCVNCKYFIPSVTNNDIHGKCSASVKESEVLSKYLVTGVKEIKPTEYLYCVNARTSINPNLCGEEGKYYKKKTAKKNNKTD